MNVVLINILKSLRKLYSLTYPDSYAWGCNWKIFSPKEYANSLIYKELMNEKPLMIARFGANELACLINYLGVKQNKKDYIAYVKGNCHAWWWNSNIIKQMNIGAGFFPISVDKIEQFCELMLQDIPEVDILGSWLPEETYFCNELQNAIKVRFLFLDPFWAKNPWSRALEGKKVLVVHPFAKTIEQQYKKKELIFQNNLLPEFELKTIKAVQSIAGTKTKFADWFEALEYMKSEIDKVDYDICLIGCGAYGFLLAAHVKRMCKKGFHLGGSLQLLFGIRGKRWEDENYNNKYNYSKLINEHWVHPGADETPSGAIKVEDACYW
jgi:hypothetical protein